MEWRGSTTTTNILNTVGFAARLNDSWTFLGRNVLASTKTKGATGGDPDRERREMGKRCVVLRFVLVEGRTLRSPEGWITPPMRIGKLQRAWNGVAAPPLPIF